MKAVTTTFLAITALAAMSLPAFAQDEETAVPVTVITNSEFCALVSQDPVACEGILTGMTTARVVPEAFAGLVSGEIPGADASAAASLEPAAGESAPPLAEESPEATQAPSAQPTAAPAAGVGDTLARDDLEVTLLKADWKPDISDSFYKPGKGQKYVSFLVRYEALEDGADYNIIFWDALDASGKRYEAEVLGQIEPDLTTGDLAAGKKVQGWVTYEVPSDVNELQIIESQVLKDDLAWSVKR
jgi:hypothetical protein